MRRSSSSISLVYRSLSHPRDSGTCDYLATSTLVTLLPLAQSSPLQFLALTDGWRRKPLTWCAQMIILAPLLLLLQKERSICDNMKAFSRSFFPLLPPNSPPSNIVFNNFEIKPYDEPKRLNNLYILWNSLEILVVQFSGLLTYQRF
ncbi:hypothetical protein Ancab_040429 [Ancistrocladus abbreviatus]